MTNEKIIDKTLNDSELNNVSGGGWGYNDFHDKAIYESCGMKCDWTNNPFKKDKFIWKGQTLHNNEASAVVFYTLNHQDENGKQLGPDTLAEAMAYKAKQGSDAYNKFRKAYNA
ncbi:MAG: bacteriocin [Anaerovibrio sp.]|uniref:bacteriocin n=1 Tax=Anaerovibrio sp. TaxID=1872532 RepID=UPI002600F247|nr:bacteriocin [Anaerovibrio sp.]MCR5177320.1 bacteriocin [Anaerovibrio sp.]